MRPEPGIHNAASNGSFPIWSCCGKGLPCDAALADTRWALTPPFHPYPNPEAGAVSFCCTVLSVEYRPQHPSFQKDSLLCAVRTFLRQKPFFRNSCEPPKETAFHRRSPTAEKPQRCNILNKLNFSRAKTKFFANSGDFRSPHPVRTSHLR